jgi:hypothetical protein
MEALFKMDRIYKTLREYPQLIINLVTELKKNYSVGQFYSQRFYETDDIKIADIFLKVHNDSKRCNCDKCLRIEDD